MGSHHFIPKAVFQIIAVLLLLICLTMTIYWIATDSGLYHTLRKWVGRNWQPVAMLLTFLALFVGWIVIIIPIRRLSKMPTMKEELGAGLDDGLPAVIDGIADLYKEQSAKNEAMYQAKEYTQEMTRRARQIGWGFLIIGVVTGLAGVWMLTITIRTGTILKLQVLLLILSPVITIAGLFQLITGKSVIRK